MRIADVCTHRVVSTQATVSVREAAEAMRQHHVGALVVVEKPNGERIPVGIVTDRDIVVAVVATGGNADKLTLGEIMSKPVATCTESEGLFAAILTMRERGVRRLPVLNAKGGLAGMGARAGGAGAAALRRRGRVVAGRWRGWARPDHGFAV